MPTATSTPYVHKTCCYVNNCHRIRNIIVVTNGISFVNRYFAVCHPAFYPYVFSPTGTATYVTICWTLTFTVSAMPLIGWSTYHFEPSQRLCFANWPASISYAVVMVNIGFCIPAIILATSNFLIFRHMRKSRNKIHQFQAKLSKSTSDENSVQNRKHKDEFRLAKSMLIIILCFFLSWFAFAFCAFVRSVGMFRVPEWLSMTSLLLGYTNCCLNPFIYGLMNTNVRNA